MKSKKNLIVLESLCGEITVVKRDDNLIIGVGDVVNHYGVSTAKIISFKKSSYDNSVTYNYDTLTQCNEPYPYILREKEIGRHFACTSNINSVKRMSENTNRVHKTWWLHENIRRKGLPKYKVILDFPGSNHRVGEVLNAYDENTFEVSTYWNNMYRNYPKIFKKVN